MLVKKVPTKDLKIGDIILYRADNQKVCHRLVKKVRDGERMTILNRKRLGKP